MSNAESVSRNLGQYSGSNWQLVCEVPMARRGIHTALALAWMNGAGNNELKQHADSATFDLIQAIMSVSHEQAVDMIRDFRDHRVLANDYDIKFTFVRSDDSQFLVRVKVALRKIALENTIKIAGLTFRAAKPDEQ